MGNQHKQNLLDWEIVLRRDLAQHEFEYDANAWSGMEGLLETGSVLTPAGKMLASVSAVKISVIIAIGLLASWLMIGLLVINYEKESNVPSRDQTLLIEEELDHSNTEAKEEQIIDPIIEIAKKTIVIKQSSETFIDKNAPSLQVVQEIREERMVPKELFLPRQKIPLLDKILLTPDSSMMEIKLMKRKRNRKALFPDVTH